MQIYTYSHRCAANQRNPRTKISPEINNNERHGKRETRRNKKKEKQATVTRRGVINAEESVVKPLGRLSEESTALSAANERKDVGNARGA